jgi:uncharacterized lipoprotein YbaY
MTQNDWTQPKAKHAVSRMAAVLVMAAGGEIRVPLSLVHRADDLVLEQDDSVAGTVIYRARPRVVIGGADSLPAPDTLAPVRESERLLK